MWGRACLQGHSVVRFEEDVDTWCVNTDGKGLLGPLLDSACGRSFRQVRTPVVCPHLCQ